MLSCHSIGKKFARSCQSGLSVLLNDRAKTPGTPVTFAGTCQEFAVSGQDWALPTQALHCNDGEIFFGAAAPYVVDARTCDPDPLGWTGEMLMLGVAQTWTDPSGGTNLFLLRGLKQQ